jgi:N-acetylglucosamine-6-phosphate deacetylase
LNPVRKGTHNASYLRLPEVSAFRRYVALSRNNIRKVTLAPELDQALSLIQEAAGIGIQISMGHSDATEKEARAAVEAGAAHATHVFNAMRPLHQREPGILGFVLTDERVFAEVIADGIHVHPTMLKLLMRMKGVDRTILITDGLSAVDMPAGRYPLGDKLVAVEGGACRDADGGLAGSVLTLDHAVRNLVDWLDLPLHEALTAASATPARGMGLATKGIIAAGADADLVFLDQQLKVVKTMVAGRIVYSCQ